MRWGDYAEEQSDGEEAERIRSLREEEEEEVRIIMGEFAELEKEAMGIVAEASVGQKGPSRESDLTNLVGLRKDDPIRRKVRGQDGLYYSLTIACADFSGEVESTEEVVHLAAQAERTEEGKNRVLRGASFLCAVVETPVGNCTTFGDAAAVISASIRRDYWSKNRPKQIGGGLVLVIKKAEWSRVVQSSDQHVGAQALVDALCTLSNGEKGAVPLEYREAIKTFERAGHARTGKTRWTEQSQKGFHYRNQRKCVEELMRVHSVIAEIMKYPGAPKELLRLGQVAYIDKFATEQRVYSKEYLVMCNEFFQTTGGSGMLDRKEEFLQRSVIGTMMRDIATIGATMKFDWVDDGTKRAEGLKPIREANEEAQKGLEPISQRVLDLLSLTREKTLSLCISSVLRRKAVLEEVAKTEEDRMSDELKWGNVELARGIPVICQTASGSTVMTTRSEGGQNGLLKEILTAAENAGSLQTLLAGRQRELIPLLSGDYERDMKKLRYERERVDRFLVFQGAEKDDNERDVYQEMMIVSPDGKLRYTSLAERVWVLNSLTQFLKRKMEPFATLRGKGEFSLSAVWEEELARVSGENPNYNVIVKVEMDLTDATFRATRKIIEEVISFVERSMPGIDPLVLAGWRRQARPSVMIREKEVHVHRTPIEERVKIPIRRDALNPRSEYFTWDYLEEAVAFLTKWLRKTGRGRFIPTVYAVQEGLMESNRRLSVLRATAGSGKTVSTILLSLVYIAVRDYHSGDMTTDEEVRIIVTTRDSVNTLAKSLGISLPLNEVSEDTGLVHPTIEEGVVIEDGSLYAALDDDFQAVYQRDLPMVGFQHRLVLRKNQRRAPVIVSTPTTWVGQVRQGAVDASCIVIDELGDNLEALSYALGQRLPTLGMSATPPKGLVLERDIIEGGGRTPLPPLEKASLQDALAEIATCSVRRNRLRVAVMLNSVAELRKAGAIIRAVPFLGQLRVREVQTWGGHAENAALLQSVPEEGECLFVISTRQISRSNDDFDLIIFPNSMRGSLRSPCGGERIVYYEMSHDEIHQISARAGRQREKVVFLSSGRPLSSIMIHSWVRTIPFREYEERESYVIGNIAHCSGLGIDQLPFKLNAWQARVASIGRRKEERLLPEDASPASLIVMAMMDGLNKISRENENLREGVESWLAGEDGELDFLRAAASIFKYAKGEEWEALRVYLRDNTEVEREYELNIIEEQIAEFAGYVLTPRDINELVVAFPDRVGELRADQRLYNVNGDEDALLDKPSREGWFLLLTGYRKVVWVPIGPTRPASLEPPLNDEEEKNAVPRSGNQEVRVVYGDEKAGEAKWVLVSTPGFATHEAEQTLHNLINAPTRDGEWQKHPETYEEVVEFDAGWVLTTQSSATLLELLLLIMNKITALILADPLQMAAIQEASLEQPDRIVDGIRVNWIDSLLIAVQGIVGGQVNMKKTTIGFLRIREVDVPFEGMGGEMLENRTGDDTMKMFFLNIPTEWFSITPDLTREGGITSGSFAKKLLSFELDAGVWRVQEIRRVIPRMISAMNCMRSTLPYNPTPGGEKEHPLLVLSNNLTEAAEPYHRMIQEFLELYPHIDCSELWLKMGKRPGVTMVNLYEVAQSSLSAIRDLSRPRQTRAGQQEIDTMCEELGKKYPLSEVNASVYAQWKVHAATLLNLYLTYPVTRQSGRARTYREIDELLSSGIGSTEAAESVEETKLSPENGGRVYMVPSAFIEEYLSSDRFVSRKIEPERVNLSSLQVLRGNHELLKLGELTPLLKQEIMAANPRATEKEILIRLRGVELE